MQNGLVVELEHLKIETRFIDKKFANLTCGWILRNSLSETFL
jgi:hypothetical protein